MRDPVSNAGWSFTRNSGVNPYKTGLVGSTDSHTSMSAVEEENFFGKHSGVEPSPERAAHVVLGGENGKIFGYQMASSGYAAVWAEENTRESIWNALKRRETYATTGSRMGVRFFGGWEFTEKDTHTRLPAEIGYVKGVPMGGDLRKAPKGAKAPSFLVAAMKDAMSGQFGSHPDHQRLARQEGQGAGKGLRCRRVRWSQDRRQRTLQDARRQHRQCQRSHLEQYHW